jgi:hypothetical protein
MRIPSIKNPPPPPKPKVCEYCALEKCGCGANDKKRIIPFVPKKDRCHSDVV